MNESAPVDGCARIQESCKVIIPDMCLGVIPRPNEIFVARSDIKVTSKQLSEQNEALIPYTANFLGAIQVEGKVTFAEAAVVLVTDALFMPARLFHSWDELALRNALDDPAGPDATLRLCRPFGDMTGPGRFHDQALAVLKTAWPDLGRRDRIIIAGDGGLDVDWTG